MEHYYKQLYARDSKGSILTWIIQVISNVNKCIVITEYGELYGNLATSSYEVTEGKNIGRANETDYFTQAINEAKSKVNKKIKEGYREVKNVDNIKNELPINRQDASNEDKPMLAQKFNSKTFEFPCFIQPKLNGVRAELGMRTVSDGLFGDKQVVYLKSREGNDYPIPPLIENAYHRLIDLNPKYRDVKFDGEIYCHGMKLQDIVSAIKRVGNPNREKLHFACYDIKSTDRQVTRINALALIPRNSAYFRIVDTDICGNVEDANRLADKFITEGFEGAIVRNAKAPYQFGKRTKYMQKIKRTMDKEFTLIDIIDSGNDSYNNHPIGMFVCKNDVNDLTFKVTPQATKKERYEYLRDKDSYIGKKITVIFRERTKDDIPFHANGLIRDYE